MDGESVIHIADLARAGTPTFEHAGRLFARNHQGVAIEVTPKNHQRTTVALRSLEDFAGIVDTDESIDGGLVVVESPTVVSAYGPLREPWNTRDAHVRAGADRVRIEGAYDVEGAILLLQGGVRPGPDRDALLAMLSTVKIDDGVSQDDDGLSQTVTVKQGAVRLGQHTVKSPVVLAPLGGFQETPLMERTYTLRLKGSTKGGLVVCLGAMLQPEVDFLECASVRDWLRDRIRNVPTFV